MVEVENLISKLIGSMFAGASLGVIFYLNFWWFFNKIVPKTCPMVR